LRLQLALLISHLCWNHPRNKALHSEGPVLAALLQVISQLCCPMALITTA
jgi:hypothetical protein